MARHHVRPDGSVGRCDAKEGGRCRFASEGALHFESAGEAQEYAAELLAHRSGGFMQGGAGSGVPILRLVVLPAQRWALARRAHLIYRRKSGLHAWAS